ncbi:hypothetical protein NIES4101_27710 (plasmid) [Calothrix sp. NIES-4101]|nr:hypothetical protein NIES4101_27710 [Calothrix sp. NIES-4101]
MKEESISVVLQPEEHVLLKSISIRQNKSESEIVIIALREYFNFLSAASSSNSCYDLALELGVVGIAKDLPSDLSTNKEYFKGFGQ